LPACGMLPATSSWRDADADRYRLGRGWGGTVARSRIDAYGAVERGRLPAYTGRPDAIGRFNAGGGAPFDLGCSQGICGCRTRDERPMSIEPVDLKTVRILLFRW